MLENEGGIRPEEELSESDWLMMWRVEYVIQNNGFHFFDILRKCEIFKNNKITKNTKLEIFWNIFIWLMIKIKKFELLQILIFKEMHCGLNFHRKLNILMVQFYKNINKKLIFIDSTAISIMMVPSSLLVGNLSWGQFQQLF